MPDRGAPRGRGAAPRTCPSTRGASPLLAAAPRPRLADIMAAQSVEEQAVLSDEALARADAGGFAARRRASEACGKLRGLAVTNPKRIAAIPDMPAMAEVLPGFELVGWYGVAAPAKLPKPILTRLHAEVVKIMQVPDIRDRILADGSEVVVNSPEEFRKYMHADLAKWAKLVKESGAKLE